MQYTLMHKEIPVLDMKLDEITGGIVETGTLHHPEHIPVGISPKKAQTAPPSTTGGWAALSSRRSGVRDALEQLGLATPQLLLSKCFGLSLSDQY